MYFTEPRMIDKTVIYFIHKTYLTEYTRTRTKDPDCCTDDLVPSTRRYITLFPTFTISHQPLTMMYGTVYPRVRSVSKICYHSDFPSVSFFVKNTAGISAAVLTNRKSNMRVPLLFQANSPKPVLLSSLNFIRNVGRLLLQ